MSSEKDRLELIRLRALTSSKLLSCFVATDINSKPAGQSKLIVTDTTHRGHWIIGANRCLAEGTLVATPTGPRRIEDMNIGDVVYSEDGKEINVIKLYKQGLKEVVELTNYGRVWAECTDDHKWQTYTRTRREGKPLSLTKMETRNIVSSKRNTIRRTEVVPPMGTISVPEAYAIGAMLGDGCCRQGSKTLSVISSQDTLIPSKVANVFGLSLSKSKGDNYNWAMKGEIISPIYDAWCRGRYAHEKIIDLEAVKLWDRESILKLLAGLIDTDGSVYHTYDGVSIAFGCQSLSAVQFVEWAMLALWQTPVTIYESKREKYVNGPIFYITVKRREFTLRIIEDLTPHLVLERKRYKPEYDEMDCHTAADKVHVSVGERSVKECYDIMVDSDTNLFLLANGLVTSNSGKTSVGAREFAWWFLGAHPFKERLPEWGAAPLLMLMVGRTSQLITEEIWANKLKPLLPPGSYKVPQKDGAFLKSVEHITNGNRILFLSHHDAKNAREKIQGFTAHVVWLDEMPDDESFLTELILRVSASGKVEPGMTLSGYLYGTFTPLVENENIKRIVDECVFPFKKWNLTLEDNPIYAGWSSEQLDAMIRAISGDEIEYRARRFGDWYYSSERVVRGYDPIRNRAPLSFPYSPSLQHALVVDPAASGKVGCTLWVLEPNPARSSPRWWCIRAVTLDGAAASLLVPQVEALVVKGARIGLRSRICDSSPSGFYKEARVQGIEYVPVMDKGDTKLNSIEHINVAFYNKDLMLADTKETDELHIENLQAKWKTDEKSIVNSHKYHCLDTTRYFWMKLPVVEKIAVEYEDHYHALKQQYITEKAARASQATKMRQRSSIWGKMPHNSRRH